MDGCKNFVGKEKKKAHRSIQAFFLYIALKQSILQLISKKKKKKNQFHVIYIKASNMH